MLLKKKEGMAIGEKTTLFSGTMSQGLERPGFVGGSPTRRPAGGLKDLFPHSRSPQLLNRSWGTCAVEAAFSVKVPLSPEAQAVYCHHNNTAPWTGLWKGGR